MNTRNMSFDAIGTKWSITIDQLMSDAKWHELQAAISSRIDEFDKSYSRFRSDSWVTAVSRKAGQYDLPADAQPMLELYEQLYQATSGKLTPLIGRTMEQSGYDATYSLKSGQMAKPPELTDVLSYDKQSVQLAEPVLLDFGAAGKGYLIDLVGQIIANAGVKSFLIDAGGDILRRTSKDDSLQIGLENPFNPTEAIGIADLVEGSLCASSGSKRQWSGMHHIIDPDNLQSPDKVAATWVLARDAMTADGLATALFFVSPRQLLKRFDFAYAVLQDNMSISCSHDFPVKLFQAV